jgi:release factor glutamine methyltransferase
MASERRVTIQDALTAGAQKLRSAGLEQPRFEAEVLLAAAMCQERLYFLMHPEILLSPEQIRAFADAIKRRAAHEPSAMITGHREFMGLDFDVNAHVLIPRPDTENIVETALAWISKRSRPEVLDLCCGSGAIGIALKHYCPDMQLWLSDISKEALAVAKSNAQKHHVAAQLILGDLFEGLPQRQRFDMIVTNPPYIPTDEIADLSPDVRDYEPRAALDGGEDGYDFYRRLFASVNDRLKEQGHLILECGWNQADTLIDMARPFSRIERIYDLAGFVRGLVCSK